MNGNDTKRLSRLTFILTQLQTKRLLTALHLSEKFGVSIRTIYRDIKALEDAGVPIITEEGRGYTLMEGYRLPPVMFTESEANALITAEQLLSTNKDASLAREYAAAVNKIKAVLRYSTKEKVELLSNRIAVSPAFDGARQSASLTLIQNALTSFTVLQLTYQSAHDGKKTERQVEPFALYYSLEESWVLIAYCRLRKDFRMFRLDRMIKVEPLPLHFEPHDLSLSEYLDQKRKNFVHP